MSSRAWQQRIQDILTAINDIQNRVVHLTFEQFASDTTIAKAVLYDFIIIGEAANQIPDTIQGQYPNVPWRDMCDMRNIVAHEYFQVSLPLVWNVIQNELNFLVTELQQILTE